MNIFIKTASLNVRDVNIKHIDKIVWNNEKNVEFKSIIENECTYLETIVNTIIFDQIDIDTGIEQMSSFIYDKAYSVNGKSIKHSNCNKNKRKNKSPWFTNECEQVRKELRSINKTYKKEKTAHYRNILIRKRRSFRLINRKARASYMTKQKRKLHTLASNNPQKFWKGIKNIKNKRSRLKNNLCADDFFNHFKHVFTNDDNFANINVENNINTNLQIEVDQLDADFTCDEILKAITSLKRGKSCGIDGLLPEMFIECKDIFTPLLTRLFNYMFSYCLYPESWTNGVIVPVPKKGDLNNENNYRGITLSSIFAKLFSIVLDSRLRNWSETNNKLNDFQFGFRKNKSTVDCVFVLTSIINKVISEENKKLYCAFIDFKKAFDTVYRNGLWFKLLENGASTKIVKMLRKMYENVKCCVRANGDLTASFDSYTGVKQGEPLSPLLFLFFINDMHQALINDEIETFTVEEMRLFLLLFADDTVLFSYTKEGLQTLLDRLNLYCKTWGITVNIDKTVVMVCKKGNKLENIELFYDNHKLNIVTKFTYLGVTLSSNGSYLQAQKILSQQAMKALYSLNSLFDNISLDISDKIKLFDSMISSILNYGCEIWGFHKAPDVERIHLKFLKNIINVRQQTTNTAIYGEFGRVPMQVIRKTRLIRYWYKILQNPDSLVFKLYNQRNELGLHVNKWANNIKDMLDNLGYSFLWDNDSVSQFNINCVINSIYDQYLQQWYADVRDLSKLHTYSIIKTSFEFENYLNHVNIDSHRVALARFRISAHKLFIEEGRHRNIPKEQRLCSKCNMNTIENEYHFLLVCPLYRQLRVNYLPKYYCHWPNMAKFIFVANKVCG